VSAVGREILVSLVAALKDEPALAAELRSLLGTGAPETKLGPAEVFLHVPAYAARVSLGERTVWSMIKRGLPTIGSGRSRRVDVERADAWLRNNREAANDVIEQSARRSARRAAKAAK
jgi:hypothetical protein